MEKVSNNIKFCAFINILRTYSSEDVSISIKEINYHMKKKLGITLDRRTMYAYIKDMRNIGLEVSGYDKEKEGYFLKDFFFKEYELKLLMDSVKASKFITKKKTEELLEKISTLNFIFRGRIVESNVFIDDSGKNINEKIYDNLNLINEAITQNKKITFNYCQNDCNQGIGCNEKDDNGKGHLKVNPISMVNNHENYYLVSIQDNLEEITYYRIENMKSIEILEEEIKDPSFIENFSYGLNASDNMETIIAQDLKEYMEIGGNNGTKY
ncbi:helix-turn-helix transcriptional regulator [Terrisporobacter muris]|uniref:WYL domain-containing protein n=1 Tax=Terrisporobacter muris TaxID=2963284 RepID=A0A9X2MA81_9FIRM|nr:WYL domain-containing protein [Terrisporobacter muris]MCR1822175.1 WYL domain-containing protein [Terrisporobacter muris]